MINKKLELAINKQINAEFYSAFFYLSMAAYLKTINLDGFAAWMNVQYQEEQSHALKLYKYLIDRGGKVVLETIEKPKNEWKDIVDVFENVYSHEQSVTSMINNLVGIAYEEKDYASIAELQWFVTEQVEEEANVSELLEQIKMINGKGAGLFMLDRELGKRTFIPIV